MPDIELRFREGFSRDLEDWLLTGQISLAVMHNPPDRADITAEKLLIETLHLIGQTGSPDKPFYTLAEAASLPLIMPSRSNYLRMLTDQHAEKIGRKLNSRRSWAFRIMRAVSIPSKDAIADPTF